MKKTNIKTEVPFKKFKIKFLTGTLNSLSRRLLLRSGMGGNGFVFCYEKNKQLALKFYWFFQCV